MYLKTLSLGDIHPYERNPRINKKAVEPVMKSIQKDGYRARIIVDKDGVIIAGHTRYEAMKRLGWTEAEVWIADDMTPEQITDYRIRDNLTADYAEWDFSELEAEIQEMNLDFDMSEFEGFEEIQGGVSDTPTAEEDDFDEDVPIESKAKLGDIYQLGQHRLICGDSTDVTVIDRLMDGARADIGFSSPPYNAMSGFNANKHMDNPYMRKGGVYRQYDDKMSDADYCGFLSKILSNMLTVCDDVLLNIGYTKGALCGTAMFLGQNAKYFAGAIHWEKSNAFTPLFDCQYGCLTNRGEPIYLFNKENRKKIKHAQWDKKHQRANIISTENAASNEYASIHGATFPVSLALEICRDFSGDVVLDVFGGTGTTMIACEQLNRKCYMCELDPHYVDVIITRWEKFTGEKAVRLNERSEDE